MSVILQHWQSCATTDGRTTVLPDGCRDLIVKQNDMAAPVWFVTDVALHSEQVDVKIGDHYNGFRLQPGVRIDHARLLAAMQAGLSNDAIRDRLDSYAKPLLQVREALGCLADGAGSVAQAATKLGVQTRSLQRLLKRETGYTPAFWLRLARVRIAASRLHQTAGLAELAYDSGFSDQAHMTREFRHWFGITPRRIRRDVGWTARHLVLGYGV